MDAEHLKEVLHLHALWIKNPEEGCRADLSRADLRGADLYRADLSGANLSRAVLSEADLYKANLYGAVLSEAYLYKVNLYGADLHGANLSRADLREAKFTVELKDAVNLNAVVYDPYQFPFLALNLSFLESVQSSVG